MTGSENAATFPDLYEASISELQNGLGQGLFTSVDLVKAYLARIEEVNLKGATLRAVIETNPPVLEQAKALDEERRVKGPRGPLHGIPMLLKDNIATLHEEGMNTTAGSHALVGSVVPRDAHAAHLLRAAGALFLGKSNLSEWANFRGIVPSGFSGRGGQAHCPYDPSGKGDPSGSSSGSATAVAVGLCAGALGTETDGSIVSPSSRNNVVGVKPTVGLVSRAGVIPISSNQDTAGPMCRTVMDASLILSAIAGRDTRDAATLEQPENIPDYSAALRPDALKGARLGVPRKLFDPKRKPMYEEFERALDLFRQLGAEVVDNADLPSTDEMRVSKAENYVMTCDLKADVNKYLAELEEVPTDVHTLADLIEWNKAHADIELISPHYDDQSQFVTSEASTIDEAYHEALKKDLELGRNQGIDAALEKYNLDALILPKDANASKPAAIAGYPVISVPLGFMPNDTPYAPEEPKPLYQDGPGYPYGIAFLGTAWSESKLLGYAYAFEQATMVRLKRRAYPEAVPQTQLADVVECT
ncbi:amidase signature enzyme [Coniophora puteana RWD-64-598 SS2]|uniref:Amidase signature enzyme n=1 Tax=Coniophora puteana (strain RWD-64-598) TaxID=741705 RepID=A0A5M3MKR8_CONPW|nr:amidase signature enzyme [Coniophora puteana RWD-64-598 SS2]EIW79617.1 amidase signature enzyme [Coniophora puteana RWD-64-598 SS2]